MKNIKGKKMENESQVENESTDMGLNEAIREAIEKNEIRRKMENKIDEFGDALIELCKQHDVEKFIFGLFGVKDLDADVAAYICSKKLPRHEKLGMVKVMESKILDE